MSEFVLGDSADPGSLLLGIAGLHELVPRFPVADDQRSDRRSEDLVLAAEGGVDL